MKTIWLVVWVWSNCGYLNSPQCYPSGAEGGCDCTIKHQTFYDPLEAGKFAGERSPLSYVVAISTPSDPDQEFLRLVEESAKKTDAEFCKKATEPWQKKAFCHDAARQPVKPAEGR